MAEPSPKRRAALEEFAKTSLYTRLLLRAVDLVGGDVRIISFAENLKPSKGVGLPWCGSYTAENDAAYIQALKDRVHVPGVASTKAALFIEVAVLLAQGRDAEVAAYLRAQCFTHTDQPLYPADSTAPAAWRCTGCGRLRPAISEASPVTAGPIADAPVLQDRQGRVRSRHVPEAVAKWVLDQVGAGRLELRRAAGDTVCAICKLEYRDHPEVQSTFVLLCDGQIGKL